MSLTYRQLKAFRAEKIKPTHMSLKKYDRKFNEEEFRGFVPKFNFVNKELCQNPFFDLSHYYTDAESLKSRILQGLVMKERQDDYWRTALKLRRREFKKTVPAKDAHIVLINEFLEERRGKLVSLPRDYLSDFLEPDYYVQDNFWYNRTDNTKTRIELEFEAQCRLEDPKNVGIHGKLTLSDLRELDAIVEPRIMSYMPGTLPWNRSISEDILRWCPSPFIFLNHLNKDEEEIRFCKIPTKVDSRIKLPTKPSYFFANEFEREILLHCDKKLDLFWKPEIAQVDMILQPSLQEYKYGWVAMNKELIPRIISERLSQIKNADFDISKLSLKELLIAAKEVFLFNKQKFLESKIDKDLQFDENYQRFLSASMQYKVPVLSDNTKSFIDNIVFDNLDDFQEAEGELFTGFNYQDDESSEVISYDAPTPRAKVSNVGKFNETTEFLEDEVESEEAIESESEDYEAIARNNRHQLGIYTDDDETNSQDSYESSDPGDPG
jgi:hypothetical protein